MPPPRVLFSNPPWWVSSRTCELTAIERISLRLAGVRAGSRWPFTYKGRSRPDFRYSHDYVPYPFFMGYATTYLARSTGAEVVLRDSIALRESYRSYFSFLAAQPFDFIFFESATPSWDHDKILIQRVKEMFPHITIVVTGPIATMGQKALIEAPVDAVIKGEYEKGSVKVLNGVRGVIEFDLLSVQEMNAAPTPYFDHSIAHRYWDSNPRGQRFPHVQVWSSRGCPYKCIFCVWPAAMTGNDPDGTGTRSVRHYSAGYMESYLSEIVERYKFKSIYFDDDTFNLGNRHTLEMCQVMQRIGLPWSAMCRADTVKIETWKAMKESGCFGVKLGFESGSQYVVDKIVNKHLDLDEAKNVVGQIKGLGMSVHGTFTYGLPGETHHQMLETKHFINSLGLTTFQESGCAEIEGAPLRTLMERGQLKAYSGALTDGYDRRTDGNVKFQILSKELKES